MADQSGIETSATKDLPSKAAANWALGHFNFASCESVTNHAWARTFRLNAADGRAAFLKVLPPVARAPAQALAQISGTFAPDVPALIAADPLVGYYLYLDHEGTDLGRSADTQTKAKILGVYAGIQAAAARLPTLFDDMARVYGPAQFDLFHNLLRQAGTGNVAPGFEGNPFLSMRTETVRKYSAIMDAARMMLRGYLATADILTPTLNHGDLRARNIAQRADGSLCIFDWDDAAYGPPGLSLHAQFSGCSRIHRALCETGSAADRDLLEIYIERLSQSDDFQAADLRAALPAAACAGVLRYIVSFARYETKSASTRKAISANVKRRMSDLMDLIGDLAAADLNSAEEIAAAFDANGRPDRAASLRDACQKAQSQGAVVSDFPQIKLPESDISKGKIAKSTIEEAAEIFARDGALLIPDAIPTDLVHDCHSAFESLRHQHEKTIRDGGALRVGNKRFMISLDLAGPFADRNLLASPFVLPILHKLLSSKAILGSLTAVASMPGASEQRVHRDNPALFSEARDLQTPSFSIAMIVPLIPLTALTGATRVMKGSHRLRTVETEGLAMQEPVVDVGSCYLMDSRLYHQGMANRSEQIRPILSMVFQRPWYRDPENFQQQSPLNIPDAGISGLAPEVKKLIEWTTGPAEAASV